MSTVVYLPLTQGKWTIVDLDCPMWILQCKWGLLNNRYARRRLPGSGRSGKSQLLHHAIMGITPPIDFDVDHINGDPLDNRRANLRICSSRENSRNSKKWSNPTSSKYKGVCWSSPKKKWRAYIVLAAKQKHLGHFDSEEDAARAYDEAAKQYFGEFARLNFP